MGCAPSSTAFDVAFATHAFQQNMIQFSAMQFTKSEIRKLYNIFTTVDVDGSGSIALAELLAHIDIARTPFTEKIFSIFDDDKSGEIDFREFVLSLWNYCTLTKATLGKNPTFCTLHSRLKSSLSHALHCRYVRI